MSLQPPFKIFTMVTNQKTTSVEKCQVNACNLKHFGHPASSFYMLRKTHKSLRRPHLLKTTVLGFEFQGSSFIFHFQHFGSVVRTGFQPPISWKSESFPGSPVVLKVKRGEVASKAFAPWRWGCWEKEADPASGLWFFLGGGPIFRGVCCNCYLLVFRECKLNIWGRFGR